MDSVLTAEEHFTDMVFTKASVGSDGVKRWAATVSEFAEDVQRDFVTPAFYEHSITQIGKSEHPTPYLVVSHLDNPSQDAMYEETPEVFRAGMPTSLYIDGNKPKAKGVFLDTPLGNALYEAVKADLDEGIPHEQRIRISMAWWPELGGVEKSDDGRTIHNKGVIKHFAATRVPIVPGTEIMIQKSNDAKRSKLEDATTIVGTELAGELWKEYALHTRSKGADDLFEKAGMDEDGESDSDDKPNFDMGKCLKIKLDEGKNRKQALGACLSMKRAAEKADLTEKQDTTITETIRPCVERLLDGGVELPLAVSICKGQSKKTARIALTRKLFGNRFLQSNKADLSVPMDECVRVYMKDHDQSREEAIATCSSDEAVTARKDAGNEKASYTLDDLLSILIDDNEMQVVSKSDDSETVPVEDGREGAEDMTENEQILADALLTVLDKLENSAPVVETVEEVTGEPEAVVAGESQPVVNAENGESPAVETVETVSQDVNEPALVKAGVKESTDVDKMVELFKSALEDDSMDQTQKGLIFNLALEQMGEAARASIQETEASPQDTAELLKAALKEVVDPLSLQVEMLIARNAELEQKSQGQAVVPQSKQLQYQKGVPVSEVQQVDRSEPKGALTALEMAEQTVTYSQPVY